MHNFSKDKRRATKILNNEVKELKKLNKNRMASEQ